MTRISDLLDYGHNLFIDDKGEAGTDRDAVWYLLKEMARVEQSIKRPGPQSAGSGMPEVYHTDAEIWAVELAMAIDGISYPPRVHQTATMKDLTLHTEVMLWLRQVRSHSGNTRRMLIVALASGMTPQQAADCRQFGLDNPQAVRAAKYRALEDILRHLENEKEKSAA